VFFARRGSAAVFVGRWLPGMRVVTSWLAGADRMPWRRFVGIGIAVVVYLLARVRRSLLARSRRPSTHEYAKQLPRWRGSRRHGV
jgi:hypothetical protein